MTSVTERPNETNSSPQPQAEPPATQADRRRPGRPAHVNPALLPLLRRDSLLGDGIRPQDCDDTGPARGIAVSVFLGLVLWAGILLLVRWLFTG